MTDPIDRLLNDVLSRAAGLFAAEVDHGRLLWSTPEGQRCYEKQRGPDYVLTVLGGTGSTVRYVVDGIDGSCLH